MCSLGRGNFCAYDWNYLAVGREFEGHFLKKMSNPYALHVHSFGLEKTKKLKELPASALALVFDNSLQSVWRAAKTMFPMS